MVVWLALAVVADDRLGGLREGERGDVVVAAGAAVLLVVVENDARSRQSPP